MDTAVRVVAPISGWCTSGIALQTSALPLVAGLGLLGGSLLILLFRRWGRGRPAPAWTPTPRTCFSGE